MSYLPFTSALHGTIHPGCAFQRQTLLDEAAHLSLRAARHDDKADALSGSRNAAHLGTAHALRKDAKYLRRRAAKKLTQAARLTEWRDGIELNDSIQWRAALARLAAQAQEPATA